jgi:phosphomannomutase
MKLKDLIKEVYDIVGAFSYNRNDLHITEELKLSILEKCKQNLFTSFGNLQVERVEDIDGYKYHFANEECVMIRASGTEPVLRVYAEASTPERVEQILTQVKETLLS